jgi:hypothetical protein
MDKIVLTFSSAIVTGLFAVNLYRDHCSKKKESEYKRINQEYAQKIIELEEKCELLEIHSSMVSINSKKHVSETLETLDDDISLRLEPASASSSDVRTKDDTEDRDKEDKGPVRIYYSPRDSEPSPYGSLDEDNDLDNDNDDNDSDETIKSSGSVEELVALSTEK